MKRLTREQAVVISAYTGALACTLSELQEFASEKLGRRVMTHEFALPGLSDELQAAVRDDFIAMVYLSKDA